ncbi:MAG: hypothetical protein WDN69_15855 [Aliidongia sp.]
MKIAVLTNRFPAVSETFIENQILSLLDLGIEVTVLASGHGPTEILHDATRRILAEAEIIYLPIPRPRTKRWLDMLTLPLKPRATLRIAGAFRRLGARPGPHDTLRLILAASALGAGTRRFDSCSAISRPMAISASGCAMSACCAAWF